jgi:ATP-binding cassette, subfamily B, multidrug efflux pump
VNPIPDEPQRRAFDSVLFGRMLSYIRPYWSVTVIALLSLLGFALVDTAMINLLRRAIDESLAPVAAFAGLSLEERYSNLLRIALLFAGFALAAFGLRYIQVYLLTLLSQRIVRDLRRDLIAKFQRLPVGYFDRHPVGRLMTRVTSDVDAINQFLTQGLVGFAQDAFLIVVFATAMLLYDVRVALCRGWGGGNETRHA